MSESDLNIHVTFSFDAVVCTQEMIDASLLRPEVIDFPECADLHGVQVGDLIVRDPDFLPLSSPGNSGYGRDHWLSASSIRNVVTDDRFHGFSKGAWLAVADQLDEYNRDRHESRVRQKINNNYRLYAMGIEVCTCGDDDDCHPDQCSCKGSI